MKKQTVKVFPDYCSSGLWLVNNDDNQKYDHVNVDADTIGVSLGLQLALKYWHDMWEFCMEYEYGEGDPKMSMSAQYLRRWFDDGRTLVKLMNEENDNYEFVYRVQEPVTADHTGRK